MAQLTGAGTLEDVFLEAVQPQGFEWCQGAGSWAGRGDWGGQTPLCGCWGWGGRGHWGGGCQQHLGGALELRARAKEEILHTLTPENGLEGQGTPEPLELGKEEGPP